MKQGGSRGAGGFDGEAGTNDLGRGGDFCLGTTSKFSGQGMVWGTQKNIWNNYSGEWEWGTI